MEWHIIVWLISWFPIWQVSTQWEAYSFGFVVNATIYLSFYGCGNNLFIEKPLKTIWCTIATDPKNVMRGFSATIVCFYLELSGITTRNNATFYCCAIGFNKLAGARSQIRLSKRHRRQNCIFFPFHFDCTRLLLLSRPYSGEIYMRFGLSNQTNDHILCIEREHKIMHNIHKAIKSINFVSTADEPHFFLSLTFYPWIYLR